MKSLVAAILIFAGVCTNLSAQPPMGMGGGGRPPGGKGGGRPPMMHGMGQDMNEPMIMGLPEIPDLTLEQREKLSKAVTDERKDISKLLKEKQDMKRESENPGLAGKDLQKLLEKMDKTDEKIKKKEEKYDKKYRSILSDDQYNIFSVNKKDIRFRSERKPDGKRPERGDRKTPPARPDSNNMQRPEISEEDMF
ncbi:Spy/CpxP family protein refolding chaperone [Dysgonomonas sp. PFB1-18]|uniref:hypothetical protein n=1 Tax=unclassified Dysgonomonas TaxID=2630389 RepID=UPI002473DB99|nr:MULTISPECIES: hypothetical protein [unclassified Dysgonomonas]MDH6308749.1 Spy/CpxP family protein refolding chaperone [Dysgonomonas sp. PF1-14]MDH6338554.1 Spy/CpxP family protein refolding chaperone [Dysgonomonas sp. PF1-16]MDH6379998.1 Spy/CpxP family protein refolding chaperone [Dysgonomonas sp. PFB1-18]MDH6397382.1 Spy/CpxP family protein refolding chaperone [Dysgonomonas sp. PF1-23]